MNEHEFALFTASEDVIMSDELLPILNHPAVLERTSVATRRILEERANPQDKGERYLSPELYALLQHIIATMLPQDVIGTTADVAACIDRRLAEGTNAGWRFADLPADGEAYILGLQAFAAILQQTPFEHMASSKREAFLRSVAEGQADKTARFPMSKWLSMLSTDAVKFWMAHPSTMQKIQYYGFADGATGATDGPTETEGWSAITSGNALPFELGVEAPAFARREA